MKIFCLRNKLFDKSASDLNKLINTIVNNNNLPSNYAFAEDIKKLPDENAHRFTGHWGSYSNHVVWT